MTDPRPVSTWLQDMRAHFPDCVVTYLRSPDGTVERGVRGVSGVQPVLQTKGD